MQIIIYSFVYSTVHDFSGMYRSILPGPCLTSPYRMILPCALGLHSTSHRPTDKMETSYFVLGFYNVSLYTKPSVVRVREFD